LFQSELKSIVSFDFPDEDIGTLNESSFGGRSTSSSSSGVLVESMLTDDEDDAMLLDEIRRSLASTDTSIQSSLYGRVDHEGLYKPLYGILVNHFDLRHTNVLLNESDYLELLSLVYMDMRGSFGKFLFDKVASEESSVMIHVALLAYYATSTAFQESELDIIIEFLREKTREYPGVIDHVPELQIERMRNQPPSLVTLADDIAKKTIDSIGDPHSMVQSMGTLIKVSKIYYQHGRIGKHLQINEEICKIGAHLRDVQVR
jgi:hypothetical protein